MGRLTALGVRNAAAGRHGDGDGLYLIVKPTGAKSWVLRVQVDGRRRDVGLGSIAALSLAEARVKSAELRKHALNGRDPVIERDRAKRIVPTFRVAAQATHDALKEGWIEKNAAAFLTSLATYAYPKLGNLKIDAVSAGDIRDMLAPIWTSKPELARKVRIRVGQVLNFSHSKGWRDTEAPGRAITMGLPKQPKGANFKAMPYGKVPAFFQALVAASPTQGRRALALQILTAARPGEIRAATWDMFDLDAALWRRPASIMKLRVAHDVTLSSAAVSLLREHTGVGTSATEVVFQGNRGKPLSDMALNKVLKDAEVPFDAHGFRSSFRDWAAEKMPEIPDAVAEAALAHAVPDRVVRAYKRTTFSSMRRELLEAWGIFLATGAAQT